MIAHLDFETRSALDLTKVGTDIYAKHPTTDVWCMSFAFDDQEIKGLRGGLLPKSLRDHVESGGLVYAHNASFEFQIWNLLCVPRYSFPPLKLEQMRCTMAMGYAMSLPGALAFIAPALGLEIEKDMEGRRLMLQMAKPRRVEEDGTLIWWDDQDRIRRLMAYCDQDVATERAVHSRLRELSPSEQQLWILDQQINMRGIHVDLPSIALAIDAVDAEKTKLDQRMRDLTQEQVQGCTKTLQIADWLTLKGVKNTGVAKADVIELLALENLPKVCRQVLLLRQEAGRSSTAKLTAMQQGASEDGRVRGTMQYHGANTGRWAGRKLQPHNFVRPELGQDDIEDVIAHLAVIPYIEMIYGGVMEVLPSCLRGMICGAPGKDLMAADYSNIESRVLAWLANEVWKLKAFYQIDKGLLPDIYRVVYAQTFGVKPEDVSKDQRQTGKPIELGLGFGGGIEAFRTMAKTYGVDLSLLPAIVLPNATPEELKKGGKMAATYIKKKPGVLTKEVALACDIIKQRWRAKHPDTVAFWYKLEKDSIKALTSGKMVDSGPVQWQLKGSFLWCRLPSGRLLCYPYPRLKETETPWGETKEVLSYMSVEATSKKFMRTTTYGGKLAENITQAVARDILSESMTRLDGEGYEIVFHVHDENIVEIEEGQGSLEEVEQICSEIPEWAKGLPISAEGWRGKRYRK